MNCQKITEELNYLRQKLDGFNELRLVNTGEAKKQIQELDSSITDLLDKIDVMLGKEKITIGKQVFYVRIGDFHGHGLSTASGFVSSVDGGVIINGERIKKRNVTADFKELRNIVNRVRKEIKE